MSQLSQFDSFVYETAITLFRPTREVLSQSFKLLQHYCQIQQVSYEMMPMMVEISIFVAESSQQIRDLKGRKVSGMGLTFSRLIGNCKSISLIIDQISKFIKIVLLDSSHINEIQCYLHKARTTNEFMSLFQSYVNKMSLVEANGIQNIKYKQTFIQIAWILYIDCRENCIQINNDAKQENNCLLASVFYFMIRYSMEHFYPQQLNVHLNDEKRVVIAKILQFLFNTFQIQQIDLYMKIADQFDGYIEKLINSSQFISIHAETNFFSPAIINFNLKQLQNKYQKRLQPKDIDYRVFRKQKSFTPIRKQDIIHRAGAVNTHVSNSKIDNFFRSHRALNYDDIESPQNDERFKLKMNLESQIKNKSEMIKNPRCSAFFISKNGQVLEGLNKQIYQYIKRLKKPVDDGLFSSFEESFSKIKETVLGVDLPNGYNCKKQFYMNIYSVFNHVCEKIQGIDFQSEQIQKCLLSLSLFIVYRMHEHQNQLLYYFGLLNGQNLIDLWYCLKVFAGNDENIPIKLLDTIKEDQSTIITSLIWLNNAFIDEVAQLAANYNKETKFVQFTQSMIQYIENFIFRMYQQLNISIDQANHAYNCMKFILSANGSILQNRNIDQILCCSIYIAGRVLRIESSVLFTEIRQAYLKMFNNRSGNPDDIFNKVFSAQSNQNIISFYNNYFIECVSPFAPYMSNPQLSLLHPLFQRKIQYFNSQSSQAYYPISMLNIMETKKPKNKKQGKKIKNCVVKNQSEGIGIIIQSDRNDTRVRIRPNYCMKNELCETERIKSFCQDEQQQQKT